VAPVGRIPHAEYERAVLAELGVRAREFAGRELVSIYFGGGTPSLWPAAHLAAVVAAVRDELAARGPLEVTLEANPCDCTPEAAAAWRAAGVGRLSIGAQSFSPRTLAILGRDHRFGDGARAAAIARAAGFPRISCDVILGTPGGLPAGQDRDPSVVAAAELGVGHLSVYELTFAERTAFGRARRAGRLQPLGEDDLAALYVAAHDVLLARGFEHYEVSSYAWAGERAVHNSLYWRGAEFLGLGMGASSFRRADAGGGGARWQNPRTVPAYLAAPPGAAAAEHEELSAADLALDRIWLGLRTRDGVTEADLAAFPAVARWLVDEGLAERDAGCIRPTLRGFLLADVVARRVVAAGSG
jgi:oxygen-independent coproporphyrinogen-3 oxidase